MANPLISVILPTRGRPNYLRHSIEMFLGQTWPNKELIILDDSTPDKQIERGLDNRIKHVRFYDELATGLKHDMGLGMATGEFICHWDDDDWYSPDRLRRQAECLIERGVDICGFSIDLLFFVETGKWGRIGNYESIHEWIGNSYSTNNGYEFTDGTAMFRRSAVNWASKYGPPGAGQKAYFLNDLVNRGSKFFNMSDTKDFVYIRHGANTWQPNWQKCLKAAERPLWFPEKEFEFYTKTKAF